MEKSTMLNLWNPFDELMNDALWARQNAERAHQPAVDVRETEAAYVIEAELPGFKPENVDVNVDNQVLTVSAERSHTEEETRKGFHRIERRTGKFRRSFTLPESVDAENIAADLRDGVLSILVPKREAVRPRKISVRTSDGTGESLLDKAKGALGSASKRSERAA
jgi:HSP20 family protein